MIKSRFCIAIVLFFGVESVFAATGLGLKINDQVVAPRGEVKRFEYIPPGSPEPPASLKIDTFFTDIRCMGLSQSGGTTRTVELDKIVDSAEGTAVFDVTSSGTISIDLANGFISVNTDDPGLSLPDPQCTHLIEAVGVIATQDLVDQNPDLVEGSAMPGTFFNSDFEPLVDVGFEETQNNSVIRIRVRNQTRTQPLRNIQVSFESSLEFAVSPGVDLVANDGGGWTWTIPLLWPRDAAESGLDESSLDLIFSQTGVPVTVTVDGEVNSWRREDDPTNLELALITVVNTAITRNL